MFVQVNTVKAIKDYFEEGLSDFYSKGEIQTLFEITCEHFLGWNRIDQKMKLSERLSESELLDFHFTLKRLKNHEPIQHILEEAPFMGLMFNVSPDTLIPRPETEELVDLIIKNIDKETKLLDIGTGSGCIPITIKNARPNLSVFATDISEKALNIAKENAAKNNVEILFEQHDVLSDNTLPKEFPETFDIIVSNPPYVRQMEKREMQRSVLDFEPHLALFVDDEDPLLFYRTIAQKSKEWLAPNGKIYFEINQYLAEETKEMMVKLGYKNIEVTKDINNNDRILYAEK